MPNLVVQSLPQFPCGKQVGEPEAGSGFKVILSYRAFEAARSYLTPDLKKKQKLREMRGERGETSVGVERERRKRKPEKLEEVGRGKRRRGHPECALGSCVCAWWGGELGLSFLRGASLLQSSWFLIHYRKRRFRAPRHRTRLLPSFLGSCQDAPAVKARKGKRGRGGRGTRAWEEGREDCAMPLRQDFLTADLSRPAWIAAPIKWVGHGPGERGPSGWMASRSDSEEPLSTSRACLVG